MATWKDAIRRGSALFELLADQPPCRVLLAEDDDAFRQLVSIALQLDGFEVVEARDGHELRDRLAAASSTQDEPYALIISDVRMPMATGLDVLETFRQTDGTTPVILMTAFGDDAVHDEAERLGAEAVFDKPFDLADLRTLAMHLSGR